jgi:hypothetical protein
LYDIANTTRKYLKCDRSMLNSTLPLHFVGITGFEPVTPTLSR